MTETRTATTDIQMMRDATLLVQNTAKVVSFLGYIVFYDNNKYAFGRIAYIHDKNIIRNIIAKYKAQFCVKHDRLFAKQLLVWASLLNITVYERHEDVDSLIMAMVVRNLAILRKRKKLLGFLSYLIIGMDDKLEKYEEYYKELTEMEKNSIKREKEEKKEV